MNQKIVFKSDQYIGLANIIGFSERSCASVKEVDLELLKRWKEKEIRRNIADHYWLSK